MLLAFVLHCVTIQGLAHAASNQSSGWKSLVRVDGQPDEIPEQWLQASEARIAHSLKLPDAVPGPVPFDFQKARWRSWQPSVSNVAVQYFNHLCETEAGEWIFKKVGNVEGFYFARPEGAPTTEMMTDPYGPEMPWIQRTFVLRSDNAHDQAVWFIQPPIFNYRFIEQPRREVKWQAGIQDPYIRLFGYTREALPIPGVYGKAYDKHAWYSYRQKTPMQVMGITEVSARYGYTWRGLKRTRDREHGIAGGEVIIYDLQTKEVLAVRRQFLIAGKNQRGPGKAMWEIAASCSQLPAYPGSGEFTQFAFDVLQTVEPSIVGK